MFSGVLVLALVLIPVCTALHADPLNGKCYWCSLVEAKGPIISMELFLGAKAPLEIANVSKSVSHQKVRKYSLEYLEYQVEYQRYQEVQEYKGLSRV